MVVLSAPPQAVPLPDEQSPAEAAEGSARTASASGNTNEQSAAVAVPERTEAGEAETDPENSGDAVASVDPRVQAPVETEPEIQPDSLMGADRAGLVAKLGAPALLRREPPAEFWQFANDGCVLHVYLYETHIPDRYEVTHIELLPRSGHDAVPDDCFGRMLLDGQQQAG